MSDGSIPDQAPAVEYWKWTPDAADYPDHGIYQLARFGEVVPGRVLEVLSADVPYVKGDPAFTKSSRKAFEAQKNIHDEREARRIPHEEEA